MKYLLIIIASTLLLSACGGSGGGGGSEDGVDPSPSLEKGVWEKFNWDEGTWQ